jgi:hypothetical protein
MRIADVKGATGLEPLQGFNQVNHLALERNPRLQSLRKLNQVGLGSLAIEKNNRLENLDGLQHITTLSGFVLEENDSIRNLQGLNGLRQIRYVESGGGTMIIESNSGLQSLKGLESLEQVKRIAVHHNPNLKRIAGMAQLTEISTHLSIYENESLRSVDSLMGLQKIGGSLTIEDNPSLPSCEVEEFVENVEVDGTVTTGNNGTGNCT